MHAIPNTHHETITGTIQGKVSDGDFIGTTIILSRTLSVSELSQLRSDVHAYCRYQGMTTSDIDDHHIKAIGTAKQHTTAFKINLVHVQLPNGNVHHETTKPISVPAAWKDKVINILGYNTKQITKPHHTKLSIPPLDVTSPKISPNGDIDTYFYPTTLARLYNFPTNLDGTNQKIGIIELGGGFVTSDISTYFAQLGISAIPNVTAVGVDGATNNPSDTSGASVEVILDIEVIAALVPKAAIQVYFAPNTDQGFYDAINTAINASCTVISISWGAPEVDWLQSTMTSYNSLFQNASLGTVSIFVASGDNGSSDGASGVNVDFPASSPYVCGCGGTSLTSTNNTSITSEVVWNDNSTTSASGGGLSAVFSKPSYQNSVSYPLGNARGVPDVSGDADPNTGYILYSQSQGGWIVVGGTSAVAPLWSGLFGRINQSLGKGMGFLQPTMYAHTSAFRDITSGNNGAYSAGIGWDPCTGNGSPNGQALLTVFSGVTPVIPVANFVGTPTNGTAPLYVQYSDESTNSPTSWSWSLGDSSTSSAQSPSHTYNTPGTYTVSLTATNTAGSNTLTRTNYITVSSPTVVAAFTGTPTSGNAPLTVSFVNQSSGSPNSWAWVFGDNSSSSSQNPSHTYTTAGTYSVSLTVSNGSSTNSITKTNYITVTNIPLVAAFTGNPTSGVAPLSVAFSDQSSGSPSAWSWNFGDTINNTSTQQNPSHTYNSGGTYTVSLTVSNGISSNTLTKNNYISVSQSALVAAFIASPVSGKSPLNVSFTDQSNGAPSNWSWNFGDGGTSTSRNPSHTYSNPGSYSVTLTVRKGANSNTLTKSGYINVTTTIPVNFSASPTSGVVPLRVSFSSSVAGATSYLWNFGSGSISSLASPTYIYSRAGTYNVSLTVTTARGTGSLTKVSYIHAT